MSRTTKKSSKRRARKGSLASLPTAALIGEITSRRDAIQAELTALNEQIADLGMLTSGERTDRRRGPGRPRKAHSGVGKGRRGNKQSLVSVLHSVLQGKTLGMNEMMEAAKAAGHKTKSKNFRTIISLALLNNRKMFKRVSRGQYTAA